MASASTSRPSASVLTTSVVRPPYCRTTSPGRYDAPPTAFSASGSSPTTRRRTPAARQAARTARTAPAPDMSVCIGSMASRGLTASPPVSKVMPLPTSTTGCRDPLPRRRCPLSGCPGCRSLRGGTRAAPAGVGPRSRRPLPAARRSPPPPGAARPRPRRRARPSTAACRAASASQAGVLTSEGVAASTGPAAWRRRAPGRARRRPRALPGSSRISVAGRESERSFSPLAGGDQPPRSSPSTAARALSSSGLGASGFGAPSELGAARSVTTRSRPRAARASAAPARRRPGTARSDAEKHDARGHPLPGRDGQPGDLAGAAGGLLAGEDGGRGRARARPRRQRANGPGSGGAAPV